MYRGQFGKTRSTATRTTAWAPSKRSTRSASVSTVAVPLTRIRFGWAKSMNSIPTRGFTTMLPRLRNMPLPS